MQLASGDGKGTRKPEVPAARANGDVELASGDNPLLRRDVPDAEVAAAQLEGGLAGLAGGEQELIEAAKLARWRSS